MAAVFGVTLLLVPVNFWAMDSFGLWHHPLDWLTALIATVTCTTITILILKNWLSASSVRMSQLGWLPILNVLLLSYLHWGWRLPGFSLIAVYLGIVGTCLVSLYQQQLYPATVELRGTAAVVVYALVVLLVRAIFVVHLACHSARVSHWHLWLAGSATITTATNTNGEKGRSGGNKPTNHYSSF